MTSRRRRPRIRAAGRPSRQGGRDLHQRHIRIVGRERTPQELKDLVPGSWRPEGVKDFWKSKEKSDILLDVLAELQNNQRVHAPIDIAPLITELAKVVPRSDLWSTIGSRASYCQSTAVYLDEDYGVAVGTWLE